MSSTSVPGRYSSAHEDAAAISNDIEGLALKAVRTLASLKLTCSLFVMAMIIVFVGSLAQSRRDVWQVMDEYFRTYIARIDIQDLFPPSMFGDYGNHLASTLARYHLRYIPFPGGWTIGWIMLANLITAHSLKFKMRAAGSRLIAGIALVVTGLAMTFAVIWTGNMQTGSEFMQTGSEYGDTLRKQMQIWWLLMGVLGISGLASLLTAVMAKSSSKLSRGVLIAISAILIGVLLYFLIGGENARLKLSSMRILWQLLKGAACSMVLLLGSMMLFDKRGGIALLHFGVAMLMISELQVGLWAKENMLSLVEGESSVFVRDIRVRELAIISQKTDGRDEVVVIPEAMLAAAAPVEKEESKNPPAAGDEKPNRRHVVSLPSLPFDVVVRRLYRNSRLRDLLPSDTLRTAEGLGSFAAPEPLDPVNGMEDTHDQSSIYVDLISRDSGKTLHRLLVSQDVSELRGPPLAEKATIDGTDYFFYLRFQRNYRDYEVTLVDVSRTMYVGSSTPKDYRSVIEIRDRKDDTKEQFTLWMNNPLRYKGETFYQSGYTPLESGKEASTISVVNNTGWMLPYIACMIVAFGMFAQFGQTLFRFLDRTERSASRQSIPNTGSATDAKIGFVSAQSGDAPEPGAMKKAPFVIMVGIPVMVSVLCAAWLGSKMRPPKENPKSMNLYSMAQLPIAWSGRAQPIDSVARTQLLVTSHKSTFEGELEEPELSVPALRKKLMSVFAKAWPTAPKADLENFSGSYTEWIDKISSITSAGKGAVEERMRPLMVRKMPAVHWFLDVITRPEVAARHRVVRIEDDRVLSLLGLEKRHGFTYSLVEIQKNMKELDEILRKARQKQRDKQESAMTEIERRVAALADTVGRIDQLSQVFMKRESDGLLGAYVDSWRILRLLGTETAVMAVPTGSADEQRSWETFVAANALRQLNQQMKTHNVETYDQFVVCLREQVPQELVTQSVIGSYRILAGMDGENEASSENGTAVQKRAAEAVARVEDDFLRQILALIAAAEPGTTPEQIAAGVPAEKAREIAAERISSEMFQVFSVISESDPDDKRLLEIRTKLQRLDTQDPSTLAHAMNEELSHLVWDDLHKRAGHLLPGGESSETFDKTSSSMAGILTAWEEGNIDEFNAAVKGHRELLASGVLPHVNLEIVKKEAWFNFFEPFYWDTYLYVSVIVMSFLGWLFFGNVLQRTSLLLLVLAFAVHTFALIMRIQISGRPPVTNLYSSAIFIGWAVVVAAFIVELMLKNGIGNILGATVGAGTLMIAHYLARDEGDTLGVMQAVLDTTFWLATHVVCITLGYAATFLAGTIGFFYCLQALMGRSLSGNQPPGEYASYMKVMGKLTYGTVCFAVFFSLVGTVLGGLWADDSWGRFWGWDPKENGAMLIVIWNALILHARWDKMAGDYGTGVLAMVGNIVTAWSWFGVNELKAGLHTYGFTEGRLLALGIFIAVQFALVIGFALTSSIVRARAVKIRSV